MAREMIPVRLQLKTAGVAPILRRIVSDLNQFEIRGAESPDPAELLIFEVGEQPDKELEVVHSLLSTGAVGEVFLTSSSSDPTILMQAMRSGAREFFPQPVQEGEVTQALERFMKRRDQARADRQSLKNGKIIDVIGSKGGVGNTTVAVNLATCLAAGSAKPSVALVDMNLLFGEVPLFLDIEAPYNWGEIARNINRLDSTFLMSVLNKHDSGVFVLPSPSQLDGNYDATPEVIERLLKLMRTVFDFIVIDSGHVSDEASMKILEMSDTVLLTAILSLPCLSNVSRFLKLFYDLGYPEEEQVRIVVNRYIKGSDVSLADAENSIGKKIFWTVPNEFKLTMSAINQGKPLMEVAGKSSVSRSIRDLAETFMERPDDQRRGSSFLGRLLSRQRA